MARVRAALAGIVALLLAVAAGPAMGPAGAQDLGGLARLAGPGALDSGATWLTLDLPLTQPVPYRARLWPDPPRAVLDFRRLDFTGLGLVPGGRAVALRQGEAGGGWTRLVIELDRPMGIGALNLATDPATGAARLTLQLLAVGPEEFDRQRAALGAEAPPAPVPLRGRAGPGPRPLRVVLDPGHGGVDPGAVQGGLSEAALMLTFGLELAEALRRAGGFEVVLTRETDVFVPLEARIDVATRAGADVFVSLHADALEDGEASGATVYTLSAEATDAASAALAERHDRADLLGGGVDLTGTEDEVALILMDIARTETRPRTERLVQALIGAIRGADLRMHRRPWQQAGFSVLKSADIPSVLIELGFLSSARDRGRLQDPEWRGRMAGALVAALSSWRDDEAARAGLRRQ